MVVVHAMPVLPERLGAVPVLPPVLLAALVVSTVVTVLAARWWALVLIPQALALPLLDKQLEGPILWVVTFGGRGHGLSLTDLAAPLGLAVAAWRLCGWGATRRRSRSGPALSASVEGGRDRSGRARCWWSPAAVHVFPR